MEDKAQDAQLRAIALDMAVRLHVGTTHTSPEVISSAKQFFTFLKGEN